MSKRDRQTRQNRLSRAADGARAALDLAVRPIEHPESAKPEWGVTWGPNTIPCIEQGFHEWAQRNGYALS